MSIDPCCQQTVPPGYPKPTNPRIVALRGDPTHKRKATLNGTPIYSCGSSSDDLTQFLPNPTLHKREYTPRGTPIYSGGSSSGDLTQFLANPTLHKREYTQRGTPIYSASSGSSADLTQILPTSAIQKPEAVLNGTPICSTLFFDPEKMAGMPDLPEQASGSSFDEIAPKPFGSIADPAESVAKRTDQQRFKIKPWKCLVM